MTRSARVWTSEPVDRSGSAIYTHLIRAPDDPERTPRREKGDPLRDTLALWRRRLLKDAPEQWAARILEHLADGVPRTFNRIAVELIDKTADIVFETPFDRGLWLLVERQQVDHSMDSPVWFRTTDRSVVDNYTSSAPVWSPPVPVVVVSKSGRVLGKAPDVLMGTHEQPGGLDLFKALSMGGGVAPFQVVEATLEGVAMRGGRVFAHAGVTRESGEERTPIMLRARRRSA